MKRIRVTCFVVLGLGIGGALYAGLKPNPLKTAAGNLIEAIFVGDIAGMATYMSSEEAKASNLNPKTLAKARELLIATPMKKATVVQKKEPEQTSNKYQASCSYFMADQNGKPWQFSTVLTQTEEGPKSIVLYPMLYSSQKFNTDGTLAADQSKKARHARMLRNIAGLEKLGIKKIYLAKGKCYTWKEFIAKQEAVVFAIHTEPGRPGPKPKTPNR